MTNTGNVVSGFQRNCPQQTHPNPKLFTSHTSQQQIKRVLLFHNVILSLSSKSLTNPKENQILSKVIGGKIMKKYRLGKYVRQELGFSQKMKENQKRPSSFEYPRKQQSNVITNADEKTFTLFRERDDNSRLTTGKRGTKTRKQLKMQK